MSDNNDGGSSIDNAELIVAIVALIIAIIAFLTAVIQLAQSIIATAKGLPNSDERVLGKWAGYSRQRLRFLRLEVEFESPVIFLAPNNNERGPVKDPKTGRDTPIWYADGSDESYENFRVTHDKDEDAIKEALGRERVSSVDNELATWIALLSAIQKMEKDSRLWEWSQWRAASSPQPDLSQQPITLAVGIQRKKRSFDATPGVKRAYATTTISHIVELAAVLGIYWKEFDRDGNKYRAEGNGYSLLGSRVDNFGVVFHFEKTGWSDFEHTRIIPAQEVKEICFGNLPTIYREKNDEADKNWRFRRMEQNTLQTLQLGSRQEVIDTLSLIGCNTNTALQFQRDDLKLTTHLFPVVFEIMGMIGRTVHVMGRPFRFLPNPTAWPWNSHRFKIRRMLTEFVKNLGESRTVAPSDLNKIIAVAEDLQKTLPEHVKDFKPTHLDEIHKAIDMTDGLLSEENKDKNVILDVLRRHIQEVVLAINNRAGPGPNSDQEPPTSPITRSISFHNILNAPPENREQFLMEKYMHEIRIRVVSIDVAHQDTQAAEASLHIHANSPQQQQQTIHDDAQAQRNHDQPPSSQPQLPGEGDGAGGDSSFARAPRSPEPRHNTFPLMGGGLPHPIRTDTIGLGLGDRRRTASLPATARASTWGAAMSRRFEPRRNEIWCTLVFRMLLWLLLHDFDKRDVQLSKSELMGSRLPVYVM